MYVWSENLSVGVAEMDEQHRHLFELVNAIFLATSGETKDPLKHWHPQLDAVMDYNLYHVKAEEEYMREFGCVDLVHIGMHRWYERKVRSLFFQASDACRKGDPKADACCNEMARFVGDWHLKHIEMTDKRYTQCFTEHGLKGS